MPAAIRIQEDNLAIMPQLNYFARIRLTLLAVFKYISVSPVDSAVENLIWHYKAASSPWGPIGGLHKTSDGYVRVHDSFSNHRDGALALVGCQPNATRAELSSRIERWRSVDLEAAAFDNRVVISALRSYSQWGVPPQAQKVADFPIALRKLCDGPTGRPSTMQSRPDKALRGLQVPELSRVIAAPLSGRTLAAHSADVVWVTSPNLPDLPTMDRDFHRGKRTIQLDLNTSPDQNKLSQLLEDEYVFGNPRNRLPRDDCYSALGFDRGRGSWLGYNAQASGLGQDKMAVGVG
ncbi:hypothetical protein ABOM_007321 [Aspergillus bombycis]|uniref:Uncharacterized protein n=1 Tax=Aspergillus bombycis TaxID=109264 RepID=A0A1F7ZYC7_9EURO|nr:hypothetical protein ABOM_007321 [Aspergillus bombycis]OGM44095.1 hypothetical protein ABOM_007321 [Aspergillus bombycis]